METHHLNKELKFREELFRKARENEEFKKELIKFPKDTISKYFQEDLTSKQVVVEDQTDETKIFLNIPRIPDLDELELTSEQLDQVAGGYTPLYIAAAIASNAACAIGAAIVGGVATGYLLAKK